MTLGPLMVDVAGLSLADSERVLLKDSRIGGVILFSRNFAGREQVQDLIRSIHAVRQPQLLIAVDQEGGRVQRFRDDFTKLPAARWLGQEFDIDPKAGKNTARLCGWLMAAELLDVGVDVSFAPVVDLDLGVSEVIGDRAFHKHPDSVASLAVAYMQGMREAGMVAVAKHFPGHGGVIADSHTELPVDNRSFDELHDDLIPYRRMIANNLQGIMLAHVKYPKIDRRIASLSPYWINTELRGNLGFTGAIFSDDLNMSATGGVGDMTARVKTTLDAGADMALICNNPEAVLQTLDEIGALEVPASQVRLVAMRARTPSWSGSALQDTPEWQTATARIAELDGRPVLNLHG
jgi:beta-N-acetylhexosaminidase